MKKSSVLEMLKNQAKKTVTCPACNMKIPEVKLNTHLDFECMSSFQSDFAVASKATRSNVVTKISPMKNKSVTRSTVPAELENVGTGIVDQDELKDLPILNIKEAKDIKYSTSSCAPWRAHSTKRKYSKTPPSGKSEKGTEVYPNVNKSRKVPCVEKGDVPMEKTSENATAKVVGKQLHLTSSKSETSPTSKEDLLEKFDDVFENVSDEKTENNMTHSPYYLANFKYIINKVLDDEYNKHLFDSADLNYIQVYNSMSDAAQKLYVRLFQRKYNWLRPYKINYPQIADDLSGFLEELLRCRFLESGSDKLELEDALDLLSLAETKSLSKHFNFNACGKSKAEINQLLINHGKQHKSFFFSNAANSVSNAILKKVTQIMGPCYRLALEPKRLFTRMLMLFSLPTIAEDDEEAAGGQQQQLFNLLQVNKGERTFPEYKLCRQCMIFEERDDLIRYETARQLENDILNAIEAKQFELGKKLYQQAENEFSDLKNCNFCERDKMIPPYLRRYTAGHVYIRCLNQGVEVLQKLRQYEEAVALLRRLLNQTVYCQDRRGRWWDRIALNLEQHLKRREEAADALKEGLQDDNVRVGYRLSLLSRAERIFSTKKDDDIKSYLNEMQAVMPAPKVTICGQLLPHPIPGRRHVFVSSCSNNPINEEGDTVTVLGVEQLAIEHYKNQGYVEGVHGEGSTFISLYALFFWDIIYDGDIADAFISPYQVHPLDLNSDSFYERRQDHIINHLDTIKNSSIEELNEILRTTWSAHNGNLSLVSWDRFTDVEQVQGLVSCLGSAIVAGICERLAKDFRFTRSGVPDLVVWNPDTKLVKIVEVKGPGDKLSPKQILWLDYLLKLGADAEVCLVEAVRSKKLKKR